MRVGAASVGGLAIVAALALGLPAAAQQTPARPAAVAQAPDDATYKAAFEETLRKPGDPATLLRYAELSIKVGNLEGAISALERLLLIEADQPRVKLELGVLYYRLGSYEAARGYLESARSSAQTTPEIKARADQMLAEVDEKTAKSQFSGEVLFAMRYSNNANSGPGGSIRSAGVTTVATPAVSGRSDFSALTASAIRHRYDLGRQDAGEFESDLSLFASRQFQISEANVMLADFTTGPRTKPFDGWADDVSLKPFFTGRYLAVHDLTTYWAWGSGLEATSPLGPSSQVALTILSRRREFVNNADVPTNTNSSGTEFVPSLEFRSDLTPALSMSFSTSMTRYIAAVGSETYTEFGVSAALSWRFRDPLGINGRTWLASVNAGVARATYDEPDTAVDANVVRRQNDVNFGLILGIPLDDTLTLVAQGTYVRRDASISNYTYDAITALTGVSWRF